MFIMTLKTFVATLCFSLIFCAALERPDNTKKSRVIDNELSDKTHYEDEEHNLDYDHDAFLGEDADEFDQMTPEESLEKLREIAHEMDKDQDGFVTHEELKHRIEHNQKRYIQEDVDGQWSTHNPDNKELFTFEDYSKSVYGFMDGMTSNDLENDQEAADYAAMKKRDERRWKKADKNGDGSLTKEEFADFMHPEESPDMKDIVVQETLEDVDTDKDGKISIEEYVGDMYKGEIGSSEPDWVGEERKQFKTHRDLDKSGYMEYEEIENWVIPQDYNHAEAEAKHLISEADDDSDGKLSIDEIVGHYDLFVGSQVTEYGEAFAQREEL